MQPRETLSTILSGHLVAQAVSVATRLGIPDLVADRPRPVEFLSRATHTHPERLYRLLRALASAGVFSEKARRRFGRTRLSELLRRGVPGSLREVAIFGGEPWHQASYALACALRTGRSSFEIMYGVPFYSYLAKHPRSLRLFTDVMAYNWSQLAGPIVRAMNCSGVRQIVDVGGGPGSLMQALLEAHEGVTGIVLDLPVVAAAARRRLASAGLARRCRVVAGDFLRQVPRGGDLYLLALILHNWDDRSALRILKRCREAMSETASLIVIEMPVPRGGRPAVAKIHDLEMLVFTSGRERTASEYKALLRAAGLRPQRIIATGTPLRLIEAVRATRRSAGAPRSTESRRNGWLGGSEARGEG